METLHLEHARRRDPLADGAGRLALARARQLLVVDARHVHMDIDPVEQRAADALLVACHHVGRAGAVLL